MLKSLQVVASTSPEPILQNTVLAAFILKPWFGFLGTWNLLLLKNKIYTFNVFYAYTKPLNNTNISMQYGELVPQGKPNSSLEVATFPTASIFQIIILRLSVKANKIYV